MEIKPITPRFNCTLKISSTDGSAHELLKKAIGKIKRAGATPAQIEEFALKSTETDFVGLLTTLKEYMNVKL